MAVLEDWDRHTVEARLADVTGLDYFRRLPEVMGAHLAKGYARAVLHLRRRASSPTHPAREFIQRRYTDNLATSPGTCGKPSIAGEIAPLTRPRSTGGALGDRGARRHRAAMAPRPLHDVIATVTTYINHTITEWCPPRWGLSDHGLSSGS